MNSTFIVARREFKANFDSPIGYVVIALTLFGVGVFFFRDYWTINRATLYPLFTWLPWALTFFVIPATTMRLFSEEKRTGTIELLITMPVRDREVVMGKFLETLGLIAVLFALTISYPLTVSRLGNLIPGPVYVGYIGLLLHGAPAVAIGLFFSSITQNQIVAFMLTFVALLGLFTVDYLGAAVGGIVGDIFAFISFQHRLAPFGRGLLDFRNALYFQLRLGVLPDADDALAREPQVEVSWTIALGPFSGPPSIAAPDLRIEVRSDMSDDTKKDDETKGAAPEKEKPESDKPAAAKAPPKGTMRRGPRSGQSAEGRPGRHRRRGESRRGQEGRCCSVQVGG